jgi:SanA protein
MMRWRVWVGIGLLLPFILIAIADFTVSAVTDRRVHTDIAQVPAMPVALVLGTAKYSKEGTINIYYRERIAAAAELFRHAKVRGILVSGDNAYHNYNEPREMRHDLVAQGVPAEYITLDYAGFRTLDSIVRAREVFGQQQIIVVSQRFHAQRALFIASAYGIEAHAYAARDVPRHWHIKTRLREVLARSAAIVDLLSGRGPKFLGKLEIVALMPLDSFAHTHTATKNIGSRAH